MAEKKEKKLTVKEFKYWLEGVEEMQDEGWYPDPRQWKRIREKIGLLDEAASMMTEVQAAGLTSIAPGIMAFPPNVNPNNPLERMNIDPANFPQPTARPPGNGPFLNDDTSKPAKTPNIDTGPGKPYASSFT